MINMDIVNEKIEEWFGGLDSGYTKLHGWKGSDDCTYYGVVRYENAIAFFRCFEIGGQMQISIDKEWRMLLSEN